MQYRTMGRNGPKVSLLGFGCGAIGGLLVKGDADEQRKTVARALEAGVTYFDTAHAYGNGRSEETIGPLLRELKADVVVGTKFRQMFLWLSTSLSGVSRSKTGDQLKVENPVAAGWATIST